jgi:hypothetical protein
MRVVEYHVTLDGQTTPELFCLVTDLNRPGFARGRVSGHLAPLGDGVSIHDFTFNRGHIVD